MTLQFWGLYSKRMIIIYSFKRLFRLKGIIRAFQRILYKAYFISHQVRSFLWFLHWSIYYKHVSKMRTILTLLFFCILFIYFSFSGTSVWTLGLMFTGQVVYHLSHSTSTPTFTLLKFNFNLKKSKNRLDLVLYTYNSST